MYSERDCSTLPMPTAFRNVRLKGFAVKMKAELDSECSDIQNVKELFQSISHDENFIDAVGFKLLHNIMYAFHQSCSPSLLAGFLTILRARPNSAKIVDADGMLLLHHLAYVFSNHNMCGCENSTYNSSDVLDLCVQSNPDGLFQSNARGETPLIHHLIQGNPSICFISGVVRANPTVVGMICPVSKRLPIHFLMSFGWRDRDRSILKALGVLLTALPSSAYHEITEEVRVFSLEAGTSSVQTRVWSPLVKAAELRDKGSGAAAELFESILFRKALQACGRVR